MNRFKHPGPTLALAGSLALAVPAFAEDATRTVTDDGTTRTVTTLFGPMSE